MSEEAPHYALHQHRSRSLQDSDPEKLSTTERKVYDGMLTRIMLFSLFNLILLSRVEYRGA